MSLSRRGFLGAMLGAMAAPAIVKSENLMRVFVPKQEIILQPMFRDLKHLPIMGPSAVYPTFSQSYNVAARDTIDVGEYLWPTVVIGPNGIEPSEHYEIDKNGILMPKVEPRLASLTRF